MEIAFIYFVTLKCYVDKRNHVYHQLTFLRPFLPFCRNVRLFEALQYDISFQLSKNEQSKKILKTLVICA